MQRLRHKKSGYTIETQVIYYEEIKKFSPGVAVANPQGEKTTRIATEPNFYNSEQEADNVSIEAGKVLLARHLSARARVGRKSGIPRIASQEAFIRRNTAKAYYALLGSS